MKGELLNVSWDSTAAVSASGLPCASPVVGRAACEALLYRAEKLYEAGIRSYEHGKRMSRHEIDSSKFAVEFYSSTHIFFRI